MDAYQAGYQVDREGGSEWELDLPAGAPDEDDDAHLDFDDGVRDRLRSTGVVIYTSAPEAYDGGGTFTDKTLNGSTMRGPMRRVVVQPENLNWQSMRYASGMHLAADQEK